MSRSKRVRKHISKRWLNWNYNKGCERTKLKDVNFYVPDGSTYKRLVERCDFW
jgi:hypothetical protein